jgi:hypothetical protein
MQEWLALQVKSQYECTAASLLTVDHVRPVAEQDINVTCTHCKVNDCKTVDSLQMQWVCYNQECATVPIFLLCNAYRGDCTVVRAAV